MRTVALYGHSLAVSSIAASLEGCAGLRVVPAEQLGAVQPDVVIFDLAASAQRDSVLALCQAQPHLLVIGVDVATDQALVLSGQTSRMLTPDDLVNVIESYTPVPVPVGPQQKGRLP